MTRKNWTEVSERLGLMFSERAAAIDAQDRFVAENYAELKKDAVFSMLVPEDLGGGGATLAEVCELLRVLGRYCASTALSLSMHQHLVAAAVFRHKKGQPAAKLLQKVATSQAVLVSTGATDWIDSNGSAKASEGGYRVSGRKTFASGSPAADLLITSFAADADPEGPSVIHCPVPLAAEGVTRLDDWHTLGMRGTGSHTVVLKDVFVPNEAVSLKRPRKQWHPAWDVTLGVAPPIYMAPYVGLAQAAAEQALVHARERSRSITAQLAAGQLENAWTTAELVWQDMVRLAGDCDFAPSLANTNAQLVRKTILTQALEQTVERAFELVGGAAFYGSLPFERMWRDVQAAHYHPLPEKRQHLFTGRYRLGLDGHWDV
jgi:alkylation response protein AidB-like acyl-CoA dehydrogenase